MTTPATGRPAQGPITIFAVASATRNRTGENKPGGWKVKLVIRPGPYPNLNPIGAGTLQMSDGAWRMFRTMLQVSSKMVNFYLKLEEHGQRQYPPRPRSQTRPATTEPHRTPPSSPPSTRSP